MQSNYLLKKNLKIICEQLQKKYSTTQAVTISWWLIEHVTKLEKSKLLLIEDFQLTQKQIFWINKAINYHLEQHKPIQYILGEIEFLDLTIKVEAPVLIPRPETEFWVNIVIDYIRNKFKDTNKLDQNFNLLDLCTGTGCIGLALANKFENCKVDAIDINPKACDLAKKNAELNNIKNFTVYKSNLFDNLDTKEKYSIIVSNPPYIKHQDYIKLDPSVKKWEDQAALTTRNNGLEIIKKIISQAPAWFKNSQNNIIGPELWLELDTWQINYVTKLLEDFGFYSITVHQDQYGKERVIQALYNLDGKTINDSKLSKY